ncbi:unnamed protein product [Lactuca saligna]|uniref:Uncharacterized protein n=1 Tax=Lactuca saligna TaxID=75948 RepID=A0AA35ZG04_LACSI|nr:unnamed protein product [Lactuca saligna]
MKTNMAAAMVNVPTFRPSSLPRPSCYSIHYHFRHTAVSITQISTTNSNPRSNKSIRFPAISCCFNSTTEDSAVSSSLSSPDNASTPLNERKPVRKYQRMFRRKQPGEEGGITEEMRFVAMKLRKKKPDHERRKLDDNDNSETEDDDSGNSDREIDGSDDDDGGTDSEDPGTWEPDLRGLMSFLVENRHVFSNIERLVDESQDVSFAYFRKTGLERSESFTKDIEWLSQQNIQIPDPQSPSAKYVKYLEELAVKNPPFFFCHLYNIYFSHIAGGQVILKKTSEKILEGRELESCQWPGDPEELLKDMREKLNALGQHWSRDVKAKCLKEASKSFMHMGAIVRLMISPKAKP